MIRKGTGGMLDQKLPKKKATSPLTMSQSLKAWNPRRKLKYVINN